MVVNKVRDEIVTITVSVHNTCNARCGFQVGGRIGYGQDTSIGAELQYQGVVLNVDEVVDKRWTVSAPPTLGDWKCNIKLLSNDGTQIVEDRGWQYAFTIVAPPVVCTATISNVVVS